MTSLVKNIYSVQAEDSESFIGENHRALESVTAMDEDGNVYPIDTGESVKIIGESALVLSEGGQLVNFRTKSSSAQVIQYLDTFSQQSGYTNGFYAADGAYLGMEDGKVKFMLSGVIGLADPSDVTILNISEAKSISHYEISDGKLIHRITLDMSKNSYQSNLDNGDAPSYLREGQKYYSYDGHYFYTYSDFENMLSDYRTGTRIHALNSESPYFNYFQYLPLRGRSNYSAPELNSMINNRLQSKSKLMDAGKIMVAAQNQHGTNALLIAGIAANESNWGMSAICQQKNNIFGINAIDTSPGESADSFSSIEECIREYTQYFVSEQYLNPENWKYSGGFLGNKASGMNVRYASDPYWGEKAAAVAWNLDRANGMKDKEFYTIGIKDILPRDTNLNVRKEATTASPVIFASGKRPYQSFLILDPEATNGFYRIQSDGLLDSNRNSVVSGEKYDFVHMFLYVSADYIDIVITGKAVPISYADTFAVRRGNQYYFKYSLSGGEADTVIAYGKPEDEILTGDWDGDGVDTLCVRRANMYYFKNTIDGGEADMIVSYGRPDDTVLVGDWNGDGKDTLCIRRGNIYYFKDTISSGNADRVTAYGRVNDEILVGDWDGNGTDTLSVRRANTYYFKNSISGGDADRVIAYGKKEDSVLSGDWDGNQTDTLCIRRGSAYYIKNTISGGSADQVFAYGKAEDIILVGTWVEKPLSLE